MAEKKTEEKKEAAKSVSRVRKADAGRKKREAGKAGAGPDTHRKGGRPEIEKTIVELAKKGETQSRIGIIMRDQYGVGYVRKLLGKKLGTFMAEEELTHEIPEDLQSLIRKSVKLSKHLEKNPGDLNTRRAAQVNESKIRRLAKYYKKRKLLDQKWKFGADKAELLVK